jgi:glycosyltransferase involved in cell wall biosynthesis
MKDKRKVIFFTSPEVGGAERMTITIAKMLDVEEFDILFVIVGRQEGNIVKFIPSQFRVELLKIRNIWDFTMLRLYKLMLREKPDVVFCSLIYLSVRVILVAKLIGKIKIIVRSNIGLYNLRKMNYNLCKITYPMADVVIAQQEEMRDEILNNFKMCADRVVTLHNPIDTATIITKAGEPSPYRNDKKPRYVWVGRISYEKGQDILIKAFQGVLSQQPNAELFFIGKYLDGDTYYQSLLTLLDELQLTEKVHFVGFDSNPYRWIKYCDCFVQPSRLEGLPNALIEAMYLGVPVVATRCIPVVDRIVDNGYNGYIVNSEDVLGMSKAMLEAPGLKDFAMTYKSASKEDFTELFK